MKDMKKVSELLRVLEDRFNNYREAGYPGLDKELMSVMSSVDSSKIIPIYSCYGHDNDTDKTCRAYGYLMFETRFPELAVALHDYIVRKLVDSNKHEWCYGKAEGDNPFVLGEEVNLTKNYAHFPLPDKEGTLIYYPWTLSIVGLDEEWRKKVWSLVEEYLLSIKEDEE